MAQDPELSPQAFQAIVDLGKMSLALGRVDRATCHPDGSTSESDTDHTVMLGLVACAFAERFAPDLDRGKIAQFAFVHDLVEVYAGDTPTAHIMTETDVSDKKAREDAALARIRSEMDPELPWVGATLEEYERLDTPEARFVKVVDKALPKITNILNSGATFKRQGHDEESGGAFLAHQHAKVRESYGSDQEAAIRLLEQAGKEMLRTIFG